MLALDVTDEGSLNSAVRTIEDAYGGVSVLINNAGYGEMGPLEEVPIEAFRRELETNVVGLLRLTQLVIPTMRRRGYGRIVNMSSMGGLMSLPGGGAYYASKYALEGLSDSLRAEVAPFGIDVIVIEPGLVTSGFNATARQSSALAPYGGPYEGLKEALRCGP
jgi:NAD(P)-dependent dehydrogenase (short-subunit alcohol dehydrogenase family)